MTLMSVSSPVRTAYDAVRRRTHAHGHTSTYIMFVTVRYPVSHHSLIGIDW